MKLSGMETILSRQAPRLCRTAVDEEGNELHKVRMWKSVKKRLIVALKLHFNLSSLNGNDDGGNRITSAPEGRPMGAVVLLSHSPLQVEQIAATDAGLMLSGHTHGGQIWPFNYLIAHYYPYLAGKYVIDDMTLIASSGTGLWRPRMRLWHPGEILEVMLRGTK